MSPTPEARADTAHPAAGSTSLTLVRQLQAEFGIPECAVFMASELQGRGLEPASAWAALRACMAP